ncbi:MAG: hypothetical protein EOO40_08160, partial [Deltaproteobacteria bacterium]
MDNFEEEIKQGFLEEAEQQLADTEQCFLLLEAEPHDRATLEKIFRLAHNIKGSSRAVGFDSLGSFTHEFESFLIKCKSGALPITGATISLMLRCNDHLNRSVQALKADRSATLNNTAIIAEIAAFGAAHARARLRRGRGMGCAEGGDFRDDGRVVEGGAAIGLQC